MKMPGMFGFTGRFDEWEIDSTLLRPEHRLDRFDGARRLAGTVADAVVRLHQNRFASHDPDRVFRTGSVTQALEPIHLLVSMTGWSVRSSAIPDLTVSARRAR